MAERVMGIADGLALRAARTVTRRRFLRNAGAGALGFALSTTFVGMRVTDAFAHGTAKHPCGPSPRCKSSQCRSGQCYVATPRSNERRVYNHWTCNANPKRNNCWSENYGTGNIHSCCDCCMAGGHGHRCHGRACYAPHLRACICRRRIG